ncbi:MAG: hypothetical protein LBM65_01440 [Oscillospiraceae bacterium]|nr:hypothetical protein [Oscillospiraceae bacterium]
MSSKIRTLGRRFSSESGFNKKHKKGKVKSGAKAKVGGLRKAEKAKSKKLNKSPRSDSKKPSSASAYSNANLPKTPLAVPAIRTGLVLCCLLLTTLTIILAWFSTATTATVDQVSVTVETPPTLEIAFYNTETEEYGEYVAGSINLDKIGVLDGIEPNDITGDGMNFVKPVLTNGSHEANKNSDWNAVSSKEYISLQMQFRSKDRMAVQLGKGTRIDPVASKLTGFADADDKKANNGSTYGDFSKDALVGAVRMSGVYASESGNVQPQWIYIPHPEILLTQSTSGYSLLTNATKENNPENFTHAYWKNDGTNITEEAVATLTGSKVKTGKDYFNSEDNAITLAIMEDDEDEPEDFDGTYYYVKATINIWVEGCDAEARRALSQGRFKVNLKFLGKDPLDVITN